jgi:hypothetical protein
LPVIRIGNRLGPCRRHSGNDTCKMMMRWIRAKPGFPVMTPRATALLVGGSLLASSACCFAQQSDDFPDSALTAVQDARRRSEQFVAPPRTQSPDPVASDKENLEAADQRAMNDPSLQRGDVISTSQGFRVFIGRDGEEHRPSDFLPAPNPKNPK